MEKREEDIVISSSLYTHTHTHKPDPTEPRLAYIKVLCPKTRRNATITLADAKKSKRDVEGKPISCDCADICRAQDSPRCYLKAQHWKGQRRNN